MEPNNELNKLEHANGKEYNKERVLELEKILGVQEVNPFKTTDSSIFEDRLAEMNYADMQALAMRVGLSPYLQKPHLKKALFKEFRQYNLNATGKLLPLTTQSIKLDPNNPAHKKALKILGEF
jgi:hypothetical protein